MAAPAQNTAGGIRRLADVSRLRTAETATAHGPAGEGWYNIGMKYSLRSLLLVVTVAAVFLGLWGENWRTCRTRQREHAEQANQLEEKVNAIAALASPYTSSPPPPPGLVQEFVQQARDHRSLEAKYRQAIWQPWKRWWIDESRLAAATANVNSH